MFSFSQLLLNNLDYIRSFGILTVKEASIYYRLGSKAENSTLYPRALYEMSRVAKRKTGRVCLLTQDKKGINKVLIVKVETHLLVKLLTNVCCLTNSDIVLQCDIVVEGKMFLMSVNLFSLQLLSNY